MENLCVFVFVQSGHCDNILSLLCQLLTWFLHYFSGSVDEIVVCICSRLCKYYQDKTIQFVFDWLYGTRLLMLFISQDNSLQAVWSCSPGERRLIRFVLVIRGYMNKMECDPSIHVIVFCSVDVSADRISVFDTGRGMDSSEENAIVKWWDFFFSFIQMLTKLGAATELWLWTGKLFYRTYTTSHVLYILIRLILQV